jgi:hypothetical protein
VEDRNRFAGGSGREEDPLVPSPQIQNPARPNFTFTYVTGGIVLHATADGRICDLAGQQVGFIGPPVMQNSLAWLKFGVLGVLDACPDGNVVANFANATWIIRGTWRVGGL